MPDRDMTEPRPTTPAEARKRVAELDPTRLRAEYRDDLTETDEVPKKEGEPE